MNKQSFGMKRMCITAVLTALCFAATYISIPLPTGAKVHLGNLVCVLAGLLCGGVVGGVTGSLGMGINDIAQGYGWSTITRTFIIKFLMGFIVGYLFRLLVKKEKASKYCLLPLTALFLGLTIWSSIVYSIGSGMISITIGSSSKEVAFSVLIPIFTGCIFFICLVACCFLNKITIKQRAVLDATILATIVNIIGEFFIRWLLTGIEQSDYRVSLVSSISKLPASMITGTITIVFAVLIYLPIYKALSHSGLLQEI